MKVATLLFKMPIGLARCILSEWLRARSLSKLDVAFCTHVERSQYMEILRGSTTLEMDSQFANRYFADRMHWMTARDVRCSTFEFSSEMLTIDDMSSEAIAALSMYIPTTAAHIQIVDIYSNDTILKLFFDLLSSNKCRLRELRCDPTLRGTIGEPGFDSAIGSILHHSSDTLTTLQAQSSMEWSRQITEKVKLPELRKIKINVTLKDLECISQAAPNLREICITRPICSAMDFAAVGDNCPHLQIFTAAGTAEVANIDTGIAVIAEKCTNLVELQLLECPNLTDSGLHPVATHCTQLMKLRLTENDHVSDAPLIALARSAGDRLAHVCLEDCTRIAGTSIAAIATHCTSLHTLSVGGMTSLTLPNLLLAIPLLRNLRKLTAFRIPINDAVLELIAAHMPCLENLDIRADGLGEYTSAGLMAMALKCEKLQRLALGDGTAEVSPLAAGLWRHLRPGLVITAHTTVFG